MLPKQGMVHRIIGFLKVHKGTVEMTTRCCCLLRMHEMPEHKGSLSGAPAALEAKLLVWDEPVLACPIIQGDRQHTGMQPVQHTSDGNRPVIGWLQRVALLEYGLDPYRLPSSRHDAAHCHGDKPLPQPGLQNINWLSARLGCHS
jgi:hypothetical protein